jgi:predicted ATPase/DNA-binding winged helix-turn-helix (wHTH) protein
LTPSSAARDVVSSAGSVEPNLEAQSLVFALRRTVSVVYEIGPFRLDPEAGVLTSAGLPMPLGGRAVAVLTALVKTPNEYVRKASILDAAWPGVIVEENSLAAQISAIRRVFARAPGGEHWVETLARRGYRFVGPVTELHDLSQAADARPRSNLPESTTSFIGRERELVEVKRLLPSTRLLTLVGVGGIGKTRLALQVAVEVIAAYRDGIWLVDLALLADPALVPSAVAQVLGVNEVAGKPIVEALCAQVRGREMLLLLDNCEHLLDACARLADALLRGTVDVTIMATSREPLCVPGEQVYLLPTLSLPDLTDAVETVGRSEAVQLFVERAQKQHPDFTLTAARASVVAHICVRLDGIPLALELAAARVRSLSVEQIHARLDDRFKLLTGGTRTALPRQQTLRATLDWSYDLLAERERAVLRHLGVFAGGFTLEAASSVASGEPIEEFDVTDLVSQLVARSLVVADTNDAGGRYRLLETTRAYALEQLDSSGERDAIERRHAQYFRSRFARAPDDWLSMREDDWRAMYLPELDNVRAALDWALGPRGDVTIGVGLCSVSGPIWMELSLATEGRQRIETALSRIADTPELDQARLWLWLGMLWGDMAPPQSVSAKSQAIELYRRLADASGLGFSLVHLALVLGIMDRLDEAANALAEALPLLEDAGLPRALARGCEIRGFLKMRSGDAAGARTHYEQALCLYRRIGVQREVLRMLGNYADLNWAIGDLDAALAGFHETLTILRNSPFPRRSTLGFNLTNLAGLQTQRGKLGEALLALREGLPLLQEAGYAWLNMDHFALRAALAGEILNAARLAGYVDEVYRKKQMSRGPNEVRARKRLQALLEKKIGPDELGRLIAEGCDLSEDEACALSIQDSSHERQASRRARRRGAESL